MPAVSRPTDAGPAAVSAGDVWAAAGGRDAPASAATRSNLKRGPARMNASGMVVSRGNIVVRGPERDGGRIRLVRVGGDSVAVIAARERRISPTIPENVDDVTGVADVRGGVGPE